GLGFLARLDVDERAQALVFAEIAAGFLLARGTELDLLHSIQPDERGDQPLLGDETMRLQRAADRAGFAAMLVYDHLRRDAGAQEARLDEIDLRFDRGQVVLRPALQNKTRAQLADIRNLRDVKPDVLGQHGRQTGHDLGRRP